MTTAGSCGDGGELEQLKAKLAQYRTSLVDLSGRNRLLNFRHTRASTLEILHPAAEELVAGLEKGWEFAPLPDEEPDDDCEFPEEADGILTQRKTTPALQRALLQLRRKSTQLFNDYGLWTLQLGVGMLNWREDGALSGSDAPLVLVPVNLERTEDGRVKLTANTDEDPRLNPALKVKLEQFHIDWSTVTAQDPTDIRAVFRAAAASIAGKSGWMLEERVVVALFASHKEAMYQDLLENEDHLLASDLVRALALGRKAGLASDRFDFEEVELDRIDELSPPEDSPLVLDADASQRQAVAAAVAGRSFVLDGPPGTGKSQTITNMIAGLMHSGRSVLFVSEKAAALDVVLDRLRSVGLDSYALPLHSHNTSRRAVAQQLGRALVEEPRAPQLSEQVVARARDSREALSRYASAMNEVREPFGQTLHDVIGRVGHLHGAPVAFLLTRSEDSEGDGPKDGGKGGKKKGEKAAFRPEALSSEDLQDIVGATKTISRAWDAVADPTFPWRQLRAGLPHPRAALDQAMAARDGLAAAIALYPDLAPAGEAVDDEAGVYRLAALLKLMDSRRPVPEEWLTSEQFADEVEGPVEVFASQLRRLNRARIAARSAGGPCWEELSQRWTAEIGEAERALAALTPPGLDPAALTEERAAKLAQEFRGTAEDLERTHGGLAGIARAAGLDLAASTEAAGSVCEIVTLAAGPYRPLAEWLGPDGPEEAEEAAVRVVADALHEFLERRERALAARAQAAADAGPDWADLGPELSAAAPAPEAGLAALDPAGLDITPLTGPQIVTLADWFAPLVRNLESAECSARALAAQLGCTDPETTADAEALAALVELSQAADRAPATWFDPQELARVRAAVAEIESAARVLAQAEQAGSDVFLPETLETPGLPEAVRRLQEGPAGLGGAFNGEVRAGRKLIGQLTPAGSWKKALGGNLDLALDWYTAHHRLLALAGTHAELLGHRAGLGGLPDVPRLRGALEHAEQVHRLAPAATADAHRRGLLADQLADGCTPKPELLEAGVGLRTDLAAWRRGLDHPHLPRHTVDLTTRRLTFRPLDAAARWLHAHLEPARQACALLDGVASVTRRGTEEDARCTLAGARTAIASGLAARRETAEFTAREAADRSLLGPWCQGLDTDPAAFAEDTPGGATGFEATGRLLRLALDLTRQRPAPYASGQDIAFLGRYAADGHPDSHALTGAATAARTIARLAPGTLADPLRRARLAEVVADGRPVPHELLRHAEGTRAELADWVRHARLPHLAAAGPELLAAPLDAAAHWFRAHVEPFEDAAELLHAVSRLADQDTEPTVAEAREAVGAIRAADAAKDRFEQDAASHRTLLGELYRGADSDRSEVLDALDWAQRVRRTAHGSRSAPLPAAATRMMRTAAPAPAVAARHADWIRQREALAAYFEPRREKLLLAELAASLAEASTLLTRLDEDPYGPAAWTDRAAALTLLAGHGLDSLPAQLAGRGVSAEDFPDAVARAVLTGWVEHQLATDARLIPIRAIERDQLVERFREADEALVESANAEVIAACNARRPRRTSLGAASLIRNEAQKQRKHMPVRVLLREAQDVVRRIKPCFMMSPLTVSQYLPPDFRFDVVIFDEASQVLPEDAVNSVYRGDQLIVAGDQKQLPPTSFFSATGDGDDDEWDENGGDGFESVLDACKASGLLRGLPLRWHYRSRHENLITFSNHEFYEGGMVTFPGALEEGPDVGVEFFKADGVYDRGGRSNNVGEAEVVAARVIHHFETRPDQSLGVVALSKSQADAIETAVQQARSARSDLDPFFTEGRLHGFFVKNLESVQGDERDVIILSVGYGRDHQGKLTTSFGPINKDGGWRRLNVAVTRARQRMEVVASFHGGELPESQNKSVRHLKRYLEYAAQGPQILQTAAADPDAEPESPFEEEVLGVLRGWGCSVQPQVGVAGFRIDMAVRHPDAPGSYALGIECDGVMYHSSRAARDRDRLREGVLRDLGWELHRIWGTDWYRNRRDAIERLRVAVEAACAADPHVRKRPVREAAPVAQAPTPEVAIPAPAPAPTPAPTGAGTVAIGLYEEPLRPAPAARSAPAPVDFAPVVSGPPAWSRPYQVADHAELIDARFRGARRLGRDNIPLQDPDAMKIVADVALRVITAEGPIEEELVFTRVRQVWNVASSGTVVKDRIRRALTHLVRQRKAVAVETAYDLPGHEVEFARKPIPRCDRKVALVPPVERRLVICHVVAEGPGAGREELLREVARFFGWTRLGSEIRTTLTGDIDELVARCAVVETSRGLTRGKDHA
ncbi:DUF4011 domain-containing protein [Streptomyces anulatus]|uniref:DUF4011 domain-containing protein n=1 Tax=Streptomyces anulatus TaxID=1892 RepID=UPI0032569BC6